MSRNFELLSGIAEHVSMPRQTNRSKNPMKPAGAGSWNAPPRAETVNDRLQRLVQAVFLSRNGSAPHVLVFCRMNGADAGPSVCEQTARLLAEGSNRSVCLLSARPSSSHAEAIADRVCAAQDCGAGCWRSDLSQIHENLWVAPFTMTAGNQGSFDEFNEWIGRLRCEFEFVLIDTAVADAKGDPYLLSGCVDGAILVVEANRTRRIAACRIKESFEAAGIRVLGTVLHNQRYPLPEALYRLL